MLRPNIILNFEIMKIYEFGKNDWPKASDSDPRTPLFYNYSPYFEDFPILTTESIMTSNLKQKTVY